MIITYYDAQVFPVEFANWHKMSLKPKCFKNSPLNLAMLRMASETFALEKANFTCIDEAFIISFASLQNLILLAGCRYKIWKRWFERLGQ